MTVIAAAKKRFGFTVVAGGAGAWQWLHWPEETRRQGIDVVFDGYVEAAGPPLFSQLLAGAAAPSCVRERRAVVDRLQPIRDPSLLGVIEISRGCGKGCQYCTMSSLKMEHVPLDTILADLRTNAAHGITAVVSSSEDFFRYGSVGGRVNFERLHQLLTGMKSVPGLRFLQMDHANISSVLQLSLDQLRELRRLLAWSCPTRYLWVNMGLESANGHLVHANGKGKIAPFHPADWEDMVKEAAHRMIEAGFFPVFSVILGLPGETPDDVARTLALVRHLSARRAVVFPIFHEPVRFEGPRHGQSFQLRQMRPAHLELYTTCYELNFQWVPKLYWDNQQAGGVPWWKRALVQGLGKAEVWSWRRNFALLGKQLSTARNAPATLARKSHT